MRTSVLPHRAPGILALERHCAVGGLKRGMMTMLAGWIAYFLLINMFVRSLNQVMVPVIELPLGFFLAMQGAVVLFVLALYVLVRQRAAVADVRLHKHRV